jgi:hypothetical protein
VAACGDGGAEQACAGAGVPWTETLIARQTLRMDRIAASSDYYRLPILSSSHKVRRLER